MPHLYRVIVPLSDIEKAQVFYEPVLGVEEKPWGETSFYFNDPFGNEIRFVDRTTKFLGSYLNVG